MSKFKLVIEFADEPHNNDEWCLNMIAKDIPRYGFSTLKATLIEED